MIMRPPEALGRILALLMSVRVASPPLPPPVSSPLGLAELADSRFSQTAFFGTGGFASDLLVECDRTCDLAHLFERTRQRNLTRARLAASWARRSLRRFRNSCSSRAVASSRCRRHHGFRRNPSFRINPPGSVVRSGNRSLGRGAGATSDFRKAST